MPSVPGKNVCAQIAIGQARLQGGEVYLENDSKFSITHTDITINCFFKSNCLLRNLIVLREKQNTYVVCERSASGCRWKMCASLQYFSGHNFRFQHSRVVAHDWLLLFDAHAPALD